MDQKGTFTQSLEKNRRLSRLAQFRFEGMWYRCVRGSFFLSSLHFESKKILLPLYFSNFSFIDILSIFPSSFFFFFCFFDTIRRMRFYSDYGRKKTIIILETNYYSNRPAKLFISKMKLYKSLHDFTLHFIRQIQFLRNKAFQKTIVKAVIEKKEN